MNQKQLDAIKERFEETTEGPWYAIAGRIYNGQVQIPWTCEDAEFIAQTHKDVPALVAEVERLQTELEKTEKCYEIIKKAAFKATDKMTHFKNALEKVMEVEAPIMEGWETPAYKIAREALGGEAHE